MEVRDKYGTIESFSNLIEEESGFIVEVEKQSRGSKTVRSKVFNCIPVRIWMY